MHNFVNVINTMHCTVEHGLKGNFYVMCILSQLIKLSKTLCLKSIRVLSLNIKLNAIFSNMDGSIDCHTE